MSEMLLGKAVPASGGAFTYLPDADRRLEVPEGRVVRDGPPIAIIGMEHSGTTYLTRKLADAGVRMWGGGGYEVGLECEVFSGMLSKELKAAEKQGRMHAQYPYDYAPDTRGDFVRRLEKYRVVRERRLKSGERWGVKEPRMGRVLPAVFDAWPDALCVYMERNMWRCVHTSWRRHVAYDAWAKLQSLHGVSGRICEWVRRYEKRAQVFVWPYEVEDEGRAALNAAFNRWAGVEVDLCSDWGERGLVAGVLPVVHNKRRGDGGC